jgi:hypothetical protein
MKQVAVVVMVKDASTLNLMHAVSHLYDQILSTIHISSINTDLFSNVRSSKNMMINAM